MKAKNILFLMGGAILGFLLMFTGLVHPIPLGLLSAAVALSLGGFGFQREGLAGERARSWSFAFLGSAVGAMMPFLLLFMFYAG